VAGAVESLLTMIAPPGVFPVGNHSGFQRGAA
jgi:hypothetical protein